MDKDTSAQFSANERSSPFKTRSAEPAAASGSPTTASQPLHEEDYVVEVDDGLDSEFAFGTDESDSTSIASSMYAGYLENGRRYQTKREGEYWGPSDERQVCILINPSRRGSCALDLHPWSWPL